jgi:hypothetical protein
MLISGAMPKWQRHFHTISAGFMCLAFAGLDWMNGRFALPPARGRTNPGLVFVSLMFIAFAAFGVGVAGLRYLPCAIRLNFGIHTPATHR